MTCEEVFAGMESKFQEFGLSKVYGVFQFHIQGRGGGSWHAICQGDSVQVGKGHAVEPDVTITTSCRNVVKMVEGRLSPHLAFLTGRVKVRGDMWLLAKIRNLLSARA